MTQDDPEKESLRAELKALKEWLTILNQEDPELRFRALVEKGSDGIAVVDAEGRFLYASPSTFRLLGYSPEELIGRKYLEFAHPDELASRVARFAECLANPRKEFQSLARVCHKDGSWRHVECISVNRLDEPCVRGVVLNFRDVTDFIAAETEKQISAQQQAVVGHLGLLALKMSSLDSLFSETVRSVADVLGVEYCKVLELLPPGDSFLLRSGVGWKEGYVGLSTVRADLESQAGYTLSQSEPVIVVDGRTETRFKFPPLLHEHGVAAGMSVVIRSRGRPFGVLGVHTVHPRHFTRKDAVFLQAVANVLASAVEESRMDQQLRENESRLRLAVDAARIGTWDWDLVTEKITWSAGQEAIFGLPVGAFQGTVEEFERCVHPDDLHELKRTVNRALAERTRYSNEYRVVWPDGSLHWIRSEGQAIYDETGKAVRMLGIVMDITDRKRTEDALHESEERFRDLLRNATDAIVAIDQDGKIVLASESAERMFGYQHDELLGKVIELLVPERLRSTHAAYVKHYIRQPVVRRMQSGGELVGRRKDGSELPLEISLTPMQMGSELLVTAFIRDISDRKRAMQSAAAQHAVARALAESASLAEASPKILRRICETVGWDVGAIWVVDEPAGVLRCSNFWLQPNIEAVNFMAATRDTALPRGAALPGRVWTTAKSIWVPDVLQCAPGPRTSSAAADRLHAAFGFPICIHDEVLAVIEFFSREVRQPDEELLQIFDSVGNMIGQFLKRKQTEELLFHSQKLDAVGSLAGGIAHEFNNLLQAISGFTRYAMEGLGAADQPYRDLQQVTLAADRAAILTRQLMSFARRQPAEIGLVDLNEIVREAEAMLRPIIGENIDVMLDLEELRALVAGDRGQLHQAVMNLCINARDSMPQGGQILIRTRSVPLPVEDRGQFGSLAPSHKVVLAVADTGSGMPADVKARAFEPFFTTKPLGQGTGLGLAIVYGTVQQHKGLIEIDSAPGQGTECRIVFPGASRAEGGPADAAPSDAQSDSLRGHETVLIAEDEELLRDLLGRALREAGYQVIAANDGSEAVSMFETHGPSISIAVLDVTMPKLGGHQVAARIREIRPRFPVVLCTGYPAAAVSPSGDEPFTRIVSKPMEWKEVFEAIRELLAHSEADRA